MTQTQLTFSSNSYWTICVKICILDNIIAPVLFICISSVNNKRSMLRFHSIIPPITEGGLPVVFTVCFCLFFTYTISNFLMQPRSQGSLLHALRSERERERETSLFLSLRRAGRRESWERSCSWWPFIFVSLCCIKCCWYSCFVLGGFKVCRPRMGLCFLFSDLEHLIVLIRKSIN